MTQQQINHEACQSLISRAFSSESITIAEFLIQTAYTLNPEMDIVHTLKECQEYWMRREANRRNISITL
jgi:hypothetical protein